METSLRTGILAAVASVMLAAGADAAGIVVRTGSPAPRREIVARRPGPNHVWIAGHWNWSAGRYVRVAGHWR